VSEAREVFIFLVIALVAAVIAVRLGMLLAPRLDRLTAPDDEDDGGDD
jgi:photosystem I reaction center subunit XII